MVLSPGRLPPDERSESDWGEVAERVRLVLVPDLVWEELLAQFQRLRTYLDVAEVPVGT